MNQGRPSGLSGMIGWTFMALGVWMIVSPQSLLGLDQLKWMYRFAFPGEVVLGALVMTVSFLLLAPKGAANELDLVAGKRIPRPEPSSTTNTLT